MHSPLCSLSFIAVALALAGALDLPASEWQKAALEASSAPETSPPAHHGHGLRAAPGEAEISRLVRELKHSSRSFNFLRSRGFAHSDEEFEELIATHPSILKQTRIVRRDEAGNRVIPGWPGVALNLDRAGREQAR